MNEYFERFKELEKIEKKIKEADVPLSERVKFDNGDIFYKGKKFFTVPIRDPHYINVLGVDNEYQTVFAGTGNCCFGHLYVLKMFEETLNLEYIMAVDTNVSDILPVSSKSVIVAGIGCAGNGVRLIEFDKPKMTDVITKEEFNSYGRVEGRPFLYAENEKIYLKPKHLFERDITPILAKHVDIKTMIERCEHFERMKR